MKKLLTLLFLIFTPVIIKAADFNINNFGLKEKYEMPAFWYFTYPHAIINDRPLISDGPDDNSAKYAFIAFDLRNGNKIQKDLERGVAIYQDEDIIYISQEKNNNKITVYSSNLEIKNEKTIDSFKIDHISKTTESGKYLLSGQKQIDNKYYRQVYLLDSKGNATKESEILTNHYTFPVMINYSITKYFVDNYNNKYYLNEDFKLKNFYTNSDNSTMFFDICKMKKVAPNGSTIIEKEFSDCENLQVVKKDNYYYVSVDSTQAYNERYDFVHIKIYKINENLDIIDSRSLPLSLIYPNKKEERTNDEIYKTSYVLAYEQNGIFFTGSTKESSNIDGAFITKTIKINDDLTTETIDNYNLNYSIRPLPLEQTIQAHTFDGFYKKANQNISRAIYAKERAKYPNDVDISTIAIEDGDNYLATFTYSRSTGTFKKNSLIYYDKDLNEIFRIDSDENLEKDNKKEVYAAPYKDYLMVAGSTAKDGNIIRMYDKKGNIVKDYSNDIKDYPDLYAYNILPCDKGLLVEFSYKKEGIRGAIQYNDNMDDPTKQKVGGKDPSEEPDEKTVFLYYTNLHNINKKTDGYGSITANYEKADEGTIIKFTITPNKGYVLNKVKVTDANGNVVYFTDYTFTMPSSDVTIEATFVKEKENPKTADITILLVGIIMILSEIIIISNKRKLVNIK